MNNINSRNREKLLGIITAAFLIVILVFTVIIEPQIHKQKELTAKQAQLQLELTKAKGNLLIKDRIEQAYTQIEPIIKVQGNQQQKISDFTRQLDQLYSKLNVKIRSVKILPAIQEKHYQKLSIRIEMLGHIKEYLIFVDAIDSYEDPVRIEQFDLASQESRDTVAASIIVTKIVSAENKPASKL